MKKRSQTTIFMAMGIVILMVFGLVFALSERANTYATQKKAERIIENFLDASTFRQTITTCLDVASVEAITLISNQGGYIYYDQPSSILTNSIPYIEFEDKKISYGIWDELPHPNDFYIYPCHERRGNQTSYPCYFNHNKTGFYFGENNPILDNSNNLPPLYKEYIPGFSFYYNYSYSFQEQIERLILNLTMRCTNTSFFKEESYGITYEEPYINATIGDSDVQVLLNFPFTVNLTKSNVVKNYQFYAQSNIRLRRVWNQMNNLIYNDMTQLDFNLGEEDIPGNMIVNKTISGTDYIFTIEDNKTFIRDRPFSLSIAIKDRRPALDCIGYCEPNREYDIIVPWNSTLTISPYAIDPDEEEVIYSYEGWKADYDELWPTNISKIGTQIPLANNLWHNSELYSNGGECNYPKDFDGKDRCASINLTQDDVGPHTITIVASDINQPYLFDFQVINILVDDVAYATIRNVSSYEDIPSNMTSIEDPFTLDASASGNLIGGNMYFFWYDTTEGFSHNTTIVTDIFPPGPDIINIINQPFTSIGLHDLYLSIVKTDSNLTSEEISYSVDVRECLPFRTEFNSSPYPFNNVLLDKNQDIIDPFLASHTCCEDTPLDWGTYSSPSKECYRYEEINCRLNVDGSGPYNKGKIIDPDLPTWPATLSSGIKNDLTTPFFDDSLNLSPEHINDIYQREFTQKCDGTRGNICNGTQRDIWSHQKTCGVCEYCSWGEEECAKYDPGIICNTQKRCVSDFGDMGYVIFSGQKDIVALGVCDDDGECRATKGNGSKIIQNQSVAPYGIYDESKDYIVSENCNNYDLTLANDEPEIETCILQDWTCIEVGEVRCGIDNNKNITINCNVYDIVPFVDEELDICSWQDWGLNSTSCDNENPYLFSPASCSMQSPEKCCEIEAQVNITEPFFDCDSLDDTNTSDNRLIESEVTYDSCVIGAIREESCNITDVTCTESNLCKLFSNFSNLPLDEVADHRCIFNSTVGYMWSNVNQTQELECSDGFDNDCDGLIDCEDDDCYSQQCEFNNIQGLCVDDGTCEVVEVCSNNNNTLKSNCYSCGLGRKCMTNLSYPYQNLGLCVYDYPLSCETGAVCQNDVGVYFSSCNNCSNGDFCDSSPIEGFYADGICAENNQCCSSQANDIVIDNSTGELFCNCQSSFNNMECDIKNTSLITEGFFVEGHCQEESCCELANPCENLNDCSGISCDQDSDCISYTDENQTCNYGYFGNYGDCTDGCSCSYQEMTPLDYLNSLGLEPSCEYGLLAQNYYCINSDKCVYNCSCAQGGWDCEIDNCPPPGTNVINECFFESQVRRDDDCKLSGCDLEIDNNPGFNASECLYSSFENNYFCFINETNSCYYYPGDPCTQQRGWELFNVEECHHPGSIVGSYCWFGNDVCNSNGCQADSSLIHPSDCSYMNNCPGINCMYVSNMIGEKCDSIGGWACFNSEFDSGGTQCFDFDADTLCDETNYCNENPGTPECLNGPIISISHLTFPVNMPRIISIRIQNLGNNGTFILTPSQNQYISIDDMEFDIPSNNYVRRFINTGEILNIDYRITPYTTGDFTITWELEYDQPWPTPNQLIDTKLQHITVVP